MEDVNDYAPEGIITLRSLYSKDRKLRVTPVFDSKTRGYLGVKRLSEDDKKKLDFWVDEDSKLTITNNIQFNLDDEVDKANWNWVKHCPAIAESFDKAQRSGRDVLFYVHNEDAQAKKELTADDLLFQALDLIKKDRDDMLEGRARVMGFNMDGDSKLAIRTFLNKMAKDPKTVLKIIEAYNSQSVGLQLMFLRATDKKVINISNGVFMYGTTPLGPTEDTAIKTLSDPANRELVTQLESELREEVVN
jgi:hypothetical protein